MCLRLYCPIFLYSLHILSNATYQVYAHGSDKDIQDGSRAQYSQTRHSRTQQHCDSTAIHNIEVSKVTSHPTYTCKPDANILSITGPTVAIVVGGSIGTQTFHVHHNLLTHTSRYFQHALHPKWRTDPTEPIALTRTRPHHFENYSQWLYSKQLPDLSDTDAYNLFARLYVLGEHIIDDTFQDVVLAAMMNAPSTIQPNLHTARIIYTNTAPDAPARRLISDILAFTITPPALEMQSLDPHTDGAFMLDLVAALATYRSLPRKNVARPVVTGPHPYAGQYENGEMPSWLDLGAATAREIYELDPHVDGAFLVELVGALVGYRVMPGKSVARPWVVETERYRRRGEQVKVREGTGRVEMERTGL